MTNARERCPKCKCLGIKRGRSEDWKCYKCGYEWSFSSILSADEVEVKEVKEIKEVKEN